MANTQAKRPTYAEALITVLCPDGDTEVFIANVVNYLLEYIDDHTDAGFPNRYTNRLDRIVKKSLVDMVHYLLIHLDKTVTDPYFDDEVEDPFEFVADWVGNGTVEKSRGWIYFRTPARPLTF